MSGSYRGLLFDFDGTLAKTMEDHFMAWRAVLRPHGLELKSEEYYPLEGSSVHELARIFAKRGTTGMPESAELVKTKEAFYLKNHKFELYPGVQNLLGVLREKRIPFGIVTAGLRERVEKSVPSGFLEIFNTVVTGEKTRRGKPHPDPYLKGAEELGLKASDCIVVENAPIGIKAAKGAEAYCVAVCSTLDPSHLGEADEVVASFEELPALGVFKKLLGD